MVHLHARSCYSLLESSLTIEQLVERSAQLGFRHVALTDKNVMYGTMKFYKTCMDHKIHPILGLKSMLCLKQERQVLSFWPKMIKVYKIYMLFLH